MLLVVTVVILGWRGSDWKEAWGGPRAGHQGAGCTHVFKFGEKSQHCEFDNALF